MGQDWPKIMITTSRNPAEQTRMFCKVLDHILPNSFVFSRGNYNLDEIHIKAMENLCDMIYFVYSKKKSVDRMSIYEIYSDKLVEIGPELKIHQFIDPKVFGFNSIPENGPLSTNLITRTYNKDLMDYFQKFFFIRFDEKLPLWLAIDVADNRKTTYVSFIDALTQKKFFFAEVELIN